MTQSSSATEFSTNGDKAEPERLAQLTAEHFQNHCLQVWQRTDRMFAGLMALQCLAGIGVALWITPRTWIIFPEDAACKCPPFVSAGSWFLIPYCAPNFCTGSLPPPIMLETFSCST